MKSTAIYPDSPQAAYLVTGDNRQRQGARLKSNAGVLERYVGVRFETSNAVFGGFAPATIYSTVTDLARLRG